MIFLFLSFTVPIALGLFAMGTPNGPRWGRGTWAPAVQAFRRAVGALHGPDLRHRHPAAERLGALDHPGLPGAHGDRLVRFENRRFQGPPIGDMIKKRQAEILAAEKAVGEI